MTESKESTIEQIASVYDLLANPDIDMKIKYDTAHFLIHKIIYTKQEQILRLIYK